MTIFVICKTGMPDRPSNAATEAIEPSTSPPSVYNSGGVPEQLSATAEHTCRSEAEGLACPVAQRRIAAESALAELLGYVRALRDGTPPFDALLPEERQEQLTELIGPQAPS